MMANGSQTNDSRSMAMKDTNREADNAREPRPGDVRIVELPYDNDLDQDELNRVHRKPGESDYVPPSKRPRGNSAQQNAGRKKRRK